MIFSLLDYLLGIDDKVNTYMTKIPTSNSNPEFLKFRPVWVNNGTYSVKYWVFFPITFFEKKSEEKVSNNDV
jgi:hypothetical protein